MPWRNPSEPTGAEKAVAGLSYLTFGIAGVLYIILGKNSSQSQFFRFHLFQSVVMWIISSLISYGAQPLFGILFSILGAVAPTAVVPIAASVGYINTGLSIAFSGLVIYGAVFAFLGKSAEIPVLSPVVRRNMR